MHNVLGDEMIGKIFLLSSEHDRLPLLAQSRKLDKLFFFDTIKCVYSLENIHLGELYEDRYQKYIRFRQQR